MKTGRLLTVLLLAFLLLSIGQAALAEEGGEALALRFVCDETVAQVTVYDPAGLPVAVGADGVHHLTPGTYYYSAEAEGYESTGLQPFTIPADAAGDQELRISLTPAADDTQPDAVPGQTPLNPEDTDALPGDENPEDDGKLRIRPVDGSLTLTVERETKAESAVPPALQKLLEGKEKPLLTADGKPVEKKLYLKTPDAEELYLDRLAVEKELGYYTTDWTVLNLTDEEGARKKLVPADSWYDVTVSGTTTEKYQGYEPVFALLTLHWDEEGDIVDRDVQILETTHTPTWSSWSFSTDTLSTLVIAIPTGQPVEEDAEKSDREKPAFAASSTVDGVTVTVNAPAGVFPADAALWVERVALTEEIDAAVEAERDGTRTVAAKYTFDIRVINPETMEEYQPEEGQTVSVSFALAEVADENLQTQVYHVTEAESTGELSAEALEVSEEGLTATAETEGFSYYQVEFTYEKLEYVLPGDTSVPLATILAELGLSGDVTEVVCSKPELFSADWDNAEKTWVVTAHRAFNTQEWMKVTINSVVYEITVTDDQEDVEEYDLWVGNVQVTSRNKDIISIGVPDIKGTVSYEGDASGGTLKLQKASIRGGHPYNPYDSTRVSNIYAGESIKNLTISVTGENTFPGNGGGSLLYSNVYVLNSLTIEGSGSLEAKGNSATSSNIIAHDLTISGTTVTTSDSETGLSSYNGITITNSAVNVKSSDIGIVCDNGSVTVEGSSNVKAEGTNCAVQVSDYNNSPTINIGSGLGITEPFAGVVKTSGHQAYIFESDRTTVATKAVIESAWVITATADENYGTVTGSAAYQKGASNQQAVITATANEGCSFVNWTENGNVVSTDNPYTFPVTADRNLTATFEETVTTYPIWVGGVQVTSANKDNILGDSASPHAAVYDPDANTLTLSNANITGSHSASLYGSSNIFSDQAGFSLTVELIGENTLSGADHSIGFYTGESASLTIHGAAGAKLTVNNNGSDNSSISARGTLLLNDVTLDGKGLSLLGGTFTDSTVAAQGMISVGDYGLTVKNSSVTAENVLYVSGALTVNGESALICKADSHDYAIWALGGITLNDGNALLVPSDGVLNASGGKVYEAGQTNYAKTVVIGKGYAVTVADAANGTVTADRTSTVAGDTVTLTITPADGYALDTLAVKQGETDVAETKVDDTTYTFTMPAGAVTVAATFRRGAIPYVDASGAAQTPVKVFTMLESVTTAWADGWYVADTDTAIGSRVTVSGNVNLILCDGATLKAGQGITVAGGNSLTIWAQSLGNEKGVLYAGTTNGTEASLGWDSAGIGGDASNTTTGAITVNGGTIYAAGNYGAGIGGGYYGSAGMIVIAGGEIHAIGGYWAAGVGSGPWTSGSGSVEITGGTVYATGGTSGAGIGAGSNGNIDSIVISGAGTVIEAQPKYSMWGGQNAAGIGGGEAGTVGTITITGGSITAAGSNAGPGIGAGGKGSCGTVTITGGSILSSSKTVTSGGEAGPGIGCGFNATVSSVEIGGSATVTAIAGYSGYLADGSVIPAIGPGVRGSFGGLTLYDTARVWAGENEASKTAILAWPDGRADACMENVYAEIQPCGHPETDSLWITEETHNLTCRYCHAKQNETKHEFQGSGDVQVCDVCGAVKVTYITAEGAAAGPKVCLQTTGDMTGDSALGGWYAVAKSTTLDTRIEITGDVNLILCDGCTLTAAGGIYVPQGASLTVWAQSTGGGMGTLTTGTPSGEQDGIGGNSGDGGTITVNGGAVTATGSGAGIGGSVTVNGGTIYAAGNYGAGIGGVVAIRGGSVTATSVDGTVTLGWSDATRAGMSVTAGSYSGTVKLEEDFCEKKTDGSPGRVFAATGEAAADDALKAAIEGVTLVPCDAYDITLSVTPAGTENAVTASVDGVPAAKAVEGSSVVLEITADEAKGYLLNSITVVDADGDNVALSGSGGFRTFNMPAGAVTVTASFTGLPLTGTVTVSGMPTYGETLTAAYTPGNNTGELSFQWLRGDTVIDGATGESYTLTGDDVGRTISCRVSSSIQTGTVASDPTEAVAKAVGTADATKGETPSAVDGMIFTGQPQELVTAPTELPEGYTGIQYSTDSGKTWGDDVPTGAEAGEYTVSVKYIGDQNHEDFSGEDLTVQIRAVVTLNPNGGAFDDPAQGEQHVIYGETAVKPEDPKRENFDFAGWYQDADCRIPFDFSTPITYSHVTFYAKWISNVYVVTSVTGTTQDDSHVWKKGSKEDAVITVELKEGEDVSFDHFTGEKHGVWFSGEKLTEGADYTADRGSTIITLKAAFLQKQSTGGHDVIIRFDNGEAQTLVTVKSPAGDGGDSTRAPKTGDESRTAFWAAMMALSGMGLVIVGTEEKRSRKPRYVGKH